MPTVLIYAALTSPCIPVPPLQVSAVFPRIVSRGCPEADPHCGGSGGCEGSTQPLAFKYLVDNTKGFDKNTDYPYKARNGNCMDDKHGGSALPDVAITGYVDLPTNNYTTLMAAVNKYGPIAISVDASWGGYESGVYSPPSSGIKTTIDHAVQLVGYGKEKGKM